MRRNLIAIGFRLVCFNSPDLLQEYSRPKSIGAPNNKKSPGGGCFWLRELDLSGRPSGHEPDELPGCSIPRHLKTDHSD
jgi:hypothetical protein